MENKLRRIQIRRGLSSQRTNVLYEEGEPVYLIDKKRLYIGDNQTFGGILAGNINFIEDSNTLPERSVYSDIIVNQKDKTVSIIEKKDNLTEIINSVNCCLEVQNSINDLNKILDEIETKIGD